MVYLFAKLFIVLPIMIFSEKSFKEASKISFKTIKGEGFQIAFLIIVGMLTWIMLKYLPFMVLKNVQFILLRVSHQIDVYWEFIFNSCKYKCIFECKDYKNKISKEKVATLDSISRDIVDSIPIIVSTKGFQSGAQAYAQSKNVTPFICRELTDEDWEDRVRSFEIHLIILGKPNVKLNIKKDTQWCEKNGYTNFKITNLKKAKIVDNEKNEIIEVELYIKNWLGLEYDAKKEEISFNNANIVYEPDCVDFKFLSIALDVTYDKTEEVIMIDGDDYIQGLVIDVVNDSRAIIMKNGEIKKINEK